jgi:hypothetical protein
VAESLNDIVLQSSWQFRTLCVDDLPRYNAPIWAPPLFVDDKPQAIASRSVELRLGSRNPLLVERLRPARVWRGRVRDKYLSGSCRDGAVDALCPPPLRGEHEK